MRTQIKTRLWLLALLAIAGGLSVAASPANSAIIPRGMADTIASPVLARGSLYWIGRNSESSTLYRRRLDSTTIEVVYHPPKRTVLIRVAATPDGVAIQYDRSWWSRGGRRSGIVKLVESASGWNAELLLEHTSPTRTKGCPFLTLLASGGGANQAVVRDLSFDGLGGDCGKLIRKRSRVMAIDAGGIRTLTDIAGPWSVMAIDGGGIRTLTDIAGPWSTPDIDRYRNTVRGTGNWLLYSEGDDQFATLENLITGVKSTLELITVNRLSEVAADGTVLTGSIVDDPGTPTLITPPAKGSARTILRRADAISWFHFCGDKMIEIHRRAPRHDGSQGAKFWRITVRDQRGNPLYTPPVKLRRATVFETCDGEIAMFHRYIDRRRGRLARQFPVVLAP